VGGEWGKGEKKGRERKGAEGGAERGKREMGNFKKTSRGIFLPPGSTDPGWKALRSSCFELCRTVNCFAELRVYKYVYTNMSGIMVIAGHCSFVPNVYIESVEFMLSYEALPICTWRCINWIINWCVK